MHIRGPKPLLPLGKKRERRGSWGSSRHPPPRPQPHGRERERERERWGPPAGELGPRSTSGHQQVRCRPIAVTPQWEEKRVWAREEAPWSRSDRWRRRRWWSAVYRRRQRKRGRFSGINRFRGLGFEPQAHQYVDHHGAGPDLRSQGLERGRRGSGSSNTRSRESWPSFESVHTTHNRVLKLGAGWVFLAS